MKPASVLKENCKILLRNKKSDSQLILHKFVREETMIDVCDGHRQEHCEPSDFIHQRFVSKKTVFLHETCPFHMTDRKDH